MKLFTLKNRQGEEFLVHGKSAKDVAKDMGISPFLFKKEGWARVDDALYNFYLKFIIVSKYEPWPEKGSKFVIRGPFTEEEYLSRLNESIKRVW